MTLKRTKIKEVLAADPGGSVTVKGWVKAFRSNRFIELNDGSCLSNIQVVVDYENFPEAVMDKLSVACAISVAGELAA